MKTGRTAPQGRSDRCQRSDRQCMAGRTAPKGLSQNSAFETPKPTGNFKRIELLPRSSKNYETKCRKITYQPYTLYFWPSSKITFLLIPVGPPPWPVGPPAPVGPPPWPVGPLATWQNCNFVENAWFNKPSMPLPIVTSSNDYKHIHMISTISPLMNTLAKSQKMYEKGLKRVYSSFSHKGTTWSKRKRKQWKWPSWLQNSIGKRDTAKERMKASNSRKRSKISLKVHMKEQLFRMTFDHCEEPRIAIQVQNNNKSTWMQMRCSPSLWSSFFIFLKISPFTFYLPLSYIY